MFTTTGVRVPQSPDFCPVGVSQDRDSTLATYLDPILDCTWNLVLSDFYRCTVHPSHATSSMSCHHATDMDSGLCGLLNSNCRVTTTYRHTDATDSPTFILAPMCGSV